MAGLAHRAPAGRFSFRGRRGARSADCSGATSGGTGRPLATLTVPTCGDCGQVLARCRAKAWGQFGVALTEVRAGRPQTRARTAPWPGVATAACDLTSAVAALTEVTWCPPWSGRPPDQPERTGQDRCTLVSPVCSLSRHSCWPSGPSLGRA